MSLLEKEGQLAQLQQQLETCEDSARRLQLEQEINALSHEMYNDLNAWDRVYLARHPQRPKAQDYLKRLFHTFYELHETAVMAMIVVIGGVAMFENTPVTVIAQAKGKDLQENLKRNFGMPNPEGYRKALRLAKEAEKFHRPIITFVDTSVLIRGKEPRNGGRQRRLPSVCLLSLI